VPEDVRAGQGDLMAGGIAYRVELPQTIAQILVQMQGQIQHLTSEVEHLRVEQREGFQQMNTVLEQIRDMLQDSVSRIEEFRVPIVERYVELDEEGLDPATLREAKACLHAEFDEFLDEESRHLAESLRRITEATLPRSVQEHAELLEGDSKEALITAQTLWKHLMDTEIAFPFDYSVCAIGLWKALEVELNRTFIDALRVHNKICDPGTPSLKQRARIREEVTEHGLFGQSTSPVTINKLSRGRLVGLELGTIGGLLANGSNNNLSKVLECAAEAGPMFSCDVGNLAEGVKRVARVYRNSYAHMLRMDQSKCEELRHFVFNGAEPCSPLLKTLDCKRAFLEAKLI